jgi:hypothetical protein
MAPRARRCPAWLRRVLIIVGLVLVGAFLLFRPVLLLPPQITRRIRLDYVAPFPGQVDFGFDDLLTFTPEKVSVPNQRWGARRVVVEKAVSDDRLRFREDRWAANRIRKTYYGDKLTSSTTVRHPNLRPPWDNAYAPWRWFLLFERFGGVDDPALYVTNKDRFSAIVHWVLDSARELPPWLCALCAPWRLEPTREITYYYDASGRLIAETHTYAETPYAMYDSFGGESGAEQRGGTSVVRHLHNEEGDEIGTLRYYGGKLDGGKIKTKDAATGMQDEYSFSASHGELFVIWDHRPSTHEGYEQGQLSWSARYDGTGTLCASEGGIAAWALFPQWKHGMGTRVYFDADRRIAADDDGIAAERSFWGSREQWWAHARYGLDCRLTADRHGEAVELWRCGGTLWPFVTSSSYGPDMNISALHFESLGPGRSGARETLRLTIVLTGALLCGCILFVVLDRMLGGRAAPQGGSHCADKP